ncbi:hypothetical protein D9757_007348 [Collybiopsis confluens]|uniref:Uncharacterized protein n=1 Tax=Collybiopsis confluens TaxID=2823264 RepID=A0A8H5HIG3_9AGAR|nr:hypothetical protein D9757_007348 [Collybiopsis confluens]
MPQRLAMLKKQQTAWLENVEEYMFNVKPSAPTLILQSRLSPLPAERTIVSPEATPRVLLVKPSDPQVTPIDPLQHHPVYHTATVKSNTRITAQALQAGSKIYAPGDVVAIHPIANADEVESFLSSKLCRRSAGNQA